MERLDFEERTPYSAVEASIHLNRYAMAKSFCQNKRVLDAACGAGYGSFLLKKWGAETVVGLDIDEQTIEKANKVFGSSGIDFQCHTVEKLPFPDFSFDLIVSFETIEHLDHPEEFLKEIRRVLKPGGVIIISCPNDPYYYREDEVSNPFHKRKYTWFDFKELVEEYLGNNVDYFLAFAVNGFMNMPISRSTEPSDAMSANMLEMMNYVECSSSLCVKQERYLNHWNSNYYVGIWGGNEVRKNISSVIFPRETFCEIKDEDVELLKEVKTWNEKKDKTYFDLKQRLKIENLKSERLSMMTELLNKEIECLRQNYDKAISEGNIKEEKTVAKLTAVRRDLETVYNELRKAQGDLQKTESNLGAVETELKMIKASKGWKLLMILYKLEGIFHRG